MSVFMPPEAAAHNGLPFSSQRRRIQLKRRLIAS